MRRHHFEVIVKLLRFTEEAKRKTKIMYHCNLSHGTVTNTIDLLLRAGLLEKNRKYYRTTAKGSEFTKGFGEIENIFSSTSIKRTKLPTSKETE